GLELGPLGTLTLRVVTPVFGSDQLVGFTELGIEIGNFLGDIGRRHANDLVMMIDKNKLNRGNWESGMQMLGETPDW
ncbi:MAG: histidine kinase, partial [Phycisphaerae bacterium]|nr:histidine kinase [Phycisphaerae bacterium]